MCILIKQLNIDLVVLQLMYDYKFDFEDDQHKIPCLCGAPNCRKWMNWVLRPILETWPHTAIGAAAWWLTIVLPLVSFIWQ